MNFYYNGLIQRGFISVSRVDTDCPVHDRKQSLQQYIIVFRRQCIFKNVINDKLYFYRFVDVWYDRVVHGKEKVKEH